MKHHVTSWLFAHVFYCVGSNQHFRERGALIIIYLVKMCSNLAKMGSSRILLCRYKLTLVLQVLDCEIEEGIVKIIYSPLLLWRKRFTLVIVGRVQLLIQLALALSFAFSLISLQISSYNFMLDTEY